MHEEKILWISAFFSWLNEIPILSDCKIRGTVNAKYCRACMEKMGAHVVTCQMINESWSGIPVKINSQIFHLGPCVLHGGPHGPCTWFLNRLFLYLSDASYWCLSFRHCDGSPMLLLRLRNSIKSCFSNVLIEAICSTVPTDHLIPQLIICTILNLHICQLFLCTSRLIFLFHLFIMSNGA